MTHTHGYARNKERADLAEQSDSNAICIASASVNLGLISVVASSVCNCDTRGNGLPQHFSRDPSVQFLSAVLN